MAGRAPFVIALAASVAACGRIGFDATSTAGDAADSATADVAPSQIRYVGPVAQFELGVGNSDSLSIRASATGNLVALQLGCNTTTPPSSVSVTAPGWTFSMPTPFTNIATLYVTMVYAVAPDTSPSTVTATWGGTTCDAHDIIGDELTGNGVPDAIDTFEQHAATGDCVATITTAYYGDAVWAACTSLGFVTGVVSPAVQGVDNADGDLTAYLLTSDPPGTSETITLTNTNDHVVSTLAIKPR